MISVTEKQDKESGGDDGSDIASDKSDSSGPSLSSKPIPPTKFDEEATKNEIISLLVEARNHSNIEIHRTTP